MLPCVKKACGIEEVLTPICEAEGSTGEPTQVLVARLEVWGSMDARGAVRFLVHRETTVRGMDGRPFDAMVENFSRTGFLFVADVALPVGTLIWIGLSGAGAREARVVWREQDRHGCEFLMPLGRRDLQRAFRGQDAVLAELEARLRGESIPDESSL